MKRELRTLGMLFLFLFLFSAACVSFAGEMIAGVGGEGQDVQVDDNTAVFGIDKDVLKKYMDFKGGTYQSDGGINTRIYKDFQYEAFRVALKGELDAYIAWCKSAGCSDEVLKMANLFDKYINDNTTFLQEIIQQVNLQGPLYFAQDGTVFSTNKSNTDAKWMSYTPKFSLTSGSTEFCTWSSCWWGSVTANEYSVQEEVKNALTAKGEDFGQVHVLSIDDKNIGITKTSGIFDNDLIDRRTGKAINTLEDAVNAADQGSTTDHTVKAYLNIDKKNSKSGFQEGVKDVNKDRGYETYDLKSGKSTGWDPKSHDYAKGFKTGAGFKVYDVIHTIKYKSIGQSRAEKVGYKYYFRDQACSSTCSSPLVLDMDGDKKIDASEGKWNPHPGNFTETRVAMFDFWGNGFPVMMEWVGPTDGILAVPKADGSIDGTCLFGTPNGFSDGYAELSLLDGNGDSVISGNELAGLHVWQDKNQDAKADSGELKSVQELGITKITYIHSNGKATFEMNGKVQYLFDWWPTMIDYRTIPIIE